MDSLKWGNPTLSDINNMGIRNYLHPLLKQLTGQPPAKNSSPAVLAELKQLVEYTQLDENSPRKHIFDGDLLTYINELFISNGIPAEKVCQTTMDILHDILPLITSLKFHYQRPRPYQLAYYYNLPLYPSFSKYITSPSYPSGHVIMCLVIAEVLQNQYGVEYPDCYETMRNFCGEVMESRLYMGVHYKSDNQFALKVVQAITSDPGFRRKYGF